MEMLSIQPSNHRTGQHQRQKSTSKVFNIQANHQLSATIPHRESHGQSSSSLQEENTMSNTQGRIETQKWHSLQETQQQPPLARPGQPTPNQQPQNGSLKNIELKPYPEYGSDQFNHQFSLSHKRNLINNGPTSLYNNINEKKDSQISLSAANFAGYLEGFETGACQNSTYNDHGRQAARPITPESGIQRLVSNWPATRESTQRPCTPQKQTNSCYFPLTPAATPFSKQPPPQCTAGKQVEDSPSRDPNLTIKASHVVKRGSPFLDLFDTSTERLEGINMISPPNSERLVGIASTDVPDFPLLDFTNIDMSTIKMDLAANSTTHDSSPCSPKLNALASAISSFQSSPEQSTISSFQSSPDMGYLSLFGNQRGTVSSSPTVGQSSVLPISDSKADLGCYPLSPNECPQSRSQSVSDFDIDATIEDTGITAEEIAAYIYGPDPVDGKWFCKYPDCNRGFGRKENIKSHIQTHLGDRQYRCAHCGNTFVRQHDLKRHAKIHSGAKPYPCLCGRSFARHDALTRHRQRNTCIGGLEGITKKPTKRGRPKKIRPDEEAPVGKAARSRQRTHEKALSMSASGEIMTTVEAPQELQPTCMMTREISSDYYSTSPELDMLPSPAPLPDFDFGFDLASNDGSETVDLPSGLLSFDEEIDKMMHGPCDGEGMLSFEKLLEQLDNPSV